MWYSAEELREEANALPPSWKVTSAEPQYKTYVVIIGESQRRDYASVYGYPLDTTPYLNRANGTFFSNFIAPGGNTGISLPRLLSYNTPGHRPLQQGKQHRHARECRGVRHLVDLEPGARRRL